VVQDVQRAERGLFWTFQLPAILLTDQVPPDKSLSFWLSVPRLTDHPDADSGPNGISSLVLVIGLGLQVGHPYTGDFVARCDASTFTFVALSEVISHFLDKIRRSRFVVLVVLIEGKHDLFGIRRAQDILGFPFGEDDLFSLR
jgi:hypothetical protein